MANPEIINKAAASFAFDVDSLVFISHSTNEVFRFSRNNQNFILRLTEKPHAYAGNIQAEVDWICYLVQNGVRAA